MQTLNGFPSVLEVSGLSLGSTVLRVGGNSSLDLRIGVGKTFP